MESFIDCYLRHRSSLFDRRTEQGLLFPDILAILNLLKIYPLGRIHFQSEDYLQVIQEYSHTGVLFLATSPDYTQQFLYLILSEEIFQIVPETINQPFGIVIVGLEEFWTQLDQERPNLQLYQAKEPNCQLVLQYLTQP